LLRLRYVYKAEDAINPGEMVNHEEIVHWIGKRETMWERLSSLDFRHIEITGRKFHPFDVKGINSILEKKNLLYGAGYGDHLKPSFFLAKIMKKQNIGRYKVYLSGKELARDLSSPPAMLQGNTIIARYEAVQSIVIDKFEEMNSRKFPAAISHAFAEYRVHQGQNQNITFKKLRAVVLNELSMYIHHELGEASQRNVLGRWWRELVMKFGQGKCELFLRGIKDILSDTCEHGTLKHIITMKKAGSLGFYVAMLGGYRKHIFKEIFPAYEKFLSSRDWSVIERARKRGYKKTREYIKIIKKMAETNSLNIETIESNLIQKIL
jgi:hypothetical protein